MKKRFTITLLLALLACGTLFADTIVYTGFPGADPPEPDCPGCSSGVWNRPDEDLQFLSGAFGTAVPYHAYAFSVMQAGFYSFLSDTFYADVDNPDGRPGWDNFLVLYQSSFDANDPLTNAVVANDDFQFTPGLSGFVSPLSTGTNYYLVTTGFSDFDQGEFKNTITLESAAIPEPATFMLLGLGLVGLAAFNRRRR